MDLGLKGKNAIVTGGTGALGGGCSKVLAREGCNIIIVHRHDTDERNAFVKSLIDEYGVSVETYICDISDHKQVEELYKKLDEKYDHLDILVNNAQSGGARGSAADITFEQWQQAMEGIFYPAFTMSRELIIRALDRNMKANIVNISAKSAEIARHKNKLGYTVAKGAINTMTKRIADDYCERGIRVNSILPGYVVGGFFSGDKEVLDAWEKDCGLRIGWATPEDMGNIVAFLASDVSRQIIGVNIDASGGTML